MIKLKPNAKPILIIYVSVIVIFALGFIEQALKKNQPTPLTIAYQLAYVAIIIATVGAITCIIKGAMMYFKARKNK